MAWRDQYGHLFRFVHIYAHTGKADMLSVGNAGADDAAVAGAKKAGSSVVIILVRGPAAFEATNLQSVYEHASYLPFW